MSCEQNYSNNQVKIS